MVTHVPFSFKTARDTVDALIRTVRLPRREIPEDWRGVRGVGPGPAGRPKPLRFRSLSQREGPPTPARGLGRPHPSAARGARRRGAGDGRGAPGGAQPGSGFVRQPHARGRKPTRGPGRPLRAPRHVRRLRREVAAAERRESRGRAWEAARRWGAAGGRPARASSADARPAPECWDREAPPDERPERLWTAAGAS